MLGRTVRPNAGQKNSINLQSGCLLPSPRVPFRLRVCVYVRVVLSGCIYFVFRSVNFFFLIFWTVFYVRFLNVQFMHIHAYTIFFSDFR